MPPSTVILWASKLVSGNSTDPTQVLGPPDGKTTTLFTSKHVVVSDFRGGGFYPLLSLLSGVTATQLATADVIAFELNGNAPAPSGGWESSRWRFEDGSSPAVAVDWNELIGASTPPGALVANGSITGSSYIAFFGIPLTSVGNVVSYILFSLPPALDLASPNFKIKLSGWDNSGHGEGTPDPDAVGLLPCHRPRKKLSRPPVGPL